MTESTPENMHENCTNLHPSSIETASDNWTRSSRSVKVGCVLLALVLAPATLWHLIAVFLYVAPQNPVSQKFNNQITGYINPVFSQDWNLFAPNPIQDNVYIEARVQIIGTSGPLDSPWVNLTAEDIARITHTPFPSHVNQNLLRRAAQFYDDSHAGQRGRTAQQQAQMSTEYLMRAVLQRLGKTWDGRPIHRVQVEEEQTPVSGPAWTGAPGQPQSGFTIMPWWDVSSSDYKGLLA